MSRPWARISGNHSAAERRTSTLLRRYLWHWLKNGFLQFEENVNTKRERDGERERGGEKEMVARRRRRREGRRSRECVQPWVWSGDSVGMDLYTERNLLRIRQLEKFYVVLKCDKALQKVFFSTISNQLRHHPALTELEKRFTGTEKCGKPSAQQVWGRPEPDFCHKASSAYLMRI